MAFCGNCVSGHLHEGTPNGSVETINGVSTYVSKPADGSKKQVILYLVDVFGYHLNNSRLLADEYASQGFYVYMPDILEGDALPMEVLQKIAPTEAEPPRDGIIDRAADKASAMASLGPWLTKHRDAVSNPIIEGFLNHIKADPHIGKIGAVGFCWGARHALLLAAGNSISAAVACHPSGLSVPSELEPITKPCAIYAGSIDPLFDEKAAIGAREVLEKHKITHEVKIYPGQTHGFAVRGDLSKREIQEGKNEVTVDTINFFKKHLA